MKKALNFKEMNNEKSNINSYLAQRERICSKLHVVNAAPLILTSGTQTVGKIYLYGA